MSKSQDILGFIPKGTLISFALVTLLFVIWGIPVASGPTFLETGVNGPPMNLRAIATPKKERFLAAMQFLK